MTVLSSVTVNAPATLKSNYAGNSSTFIPKILDVIEGTGVQRTPGFHSLKGPARQKPGPNYWKQWTHEDRGYVFQNHTESGPGGQFFYSYQAGPYPSSLFPENSRLAGCVIEATYAAKIKLFAQMKGEGANLANMLGERHQVVQSVQNVLNTLVGTVRDLRHGRFTSAIRRMGGDPVTARKLRKMDIANQWLSLQYGWKPLLSDVYDVINGAHKREKNNPVVFRASGSFEQSVPSDSSWAFGTDYNGKTVNYGVKKTKAVAKYMIRAFPNAVLIEPAALGFTNPLEVAWEVTPWSFVVDWFLPVGNWLDQLTADHGWLFGDGCASTLEKSSESAGFSFSKNYSTPPWDYTNFRQQGGTYTRQDIFRRNGLSDFPSPDIPKFKNPLSIAHVENSIALLSQLMSGGKVHK